MSFALDVIEAGMVAFAPDYLRDGERIDPGDAPYNTTRFYEQFPEWSIHGKDAWDTMRAVDYLQSLDFVDGEAIGMMGHSYGGHSTIFCTSLEPRIKAAVANGPVSAFREHGMHWAVPKGGGNSQSLPAMREYILNPDLPLPATFAEWTALIAPRPLWVGQAVGERRPIEEENCGYVTRVYQSLGGADRVQYVWYAGDHDFPPAARQAAVAWLQRWLRGSARGR
jgi:predicted acyl esterase